MLHSYLIHLVRTHSWPSPIFDCR